MNNGILLVFVKSYQDNTSNERYFQSIILFNVHSMLRKKNFTKQDGKQLALGVANKGKKKVKDYTKRKCFHCGKKGHWKRNCPKFIAGKNKGMMRSFLLEICLLHNPTDSWCVDSVCTNYICYTL